MKKYACFDCQFSWELHKHEPEALSCPKCDSTNIVGMAEVLQE